jgi:predicted dehydrogenase
MPKRINIGIVGCGRILPAHLRGYRLLREKGIDTFRITALVSRTRADAEMFRKRGEGPPPRPPVSQNPDDPLSAPHIYVSDFQDDVEARVFDSVEEMLEKGDVDAVDIPASVAVHHTIALQCLAAGKHCLVQKPFAITVRAAQRMVEAARARNLRLGVVENVRYAESTRIARWLIDAGYLGEIQMAMFPSIGTEWSPNKIVAQTPWRHRKLQAGAGASLDIGVHLFHRLRYLVSEVEEVSAMTAIFEPERYTFDAQGNIIARVRPDVDDAFFATFRFTTGALGQMSFTWAGHGEPTRLAEGMVLYGTKGCLKGDRLVLDNGEVLSARALFESEAPATVKERFFPLGLRDAFALGFLDFLRGIEEGRDPETSGVEGTRDLATSYAIVESALAGRPVRVEDVLSGRVEAYQAEINAHYNL